MLYPNSRRVKGVDPNRDYPTKRNPNKKSIPIIQAVRNFTEEIKPDIAISGHTFGRLWLYPWGDTESDCNNKEDYLRILRKMQEVSGYKPLKLSKVYGHPIYGTELDWYYRQNVFAIVAEYGEHQRPPNFEEIRVEFEKTYMAILYFIEMGINLHEL
jgi:hypothetical protein